MAVRGIFVPGHCLTRDGSRLTVMARVATENAAKLMLDDGADFIILAAAYEATWEKDAAFKKEIVVKAGVDPARVRIVPAITSTFDEAKKVRTIINELGLTSLIVVTDEYHALRVPAAFRPLYPGIHILTEPFTTPKFEMMLEPSLIKSIRAGNKFLWILWNVGLSFLPPK